MKPKEVICVGLSGGVDSSTSAAVLQAAGFDVHATFIKVWQPDWLQCTWKEDRKDALRVAAHLNLPFHTLDAEKEYKQGVVDYMLNEYKAGRTPNPDVMCNREVKFGIFLKWALAHGATKVATGHYAQKKIVDGKPALFTSVDEEKDQTYFLWTLTQDQLSHIEFPIGHLNKKDVRKLATKYKLPTATKKDSQGICFLGPVDMKDFLKHYITPEEGKVLNEKGEVIGTHEGALLYTIGERHGFTITKKTPDDDRFFVIARDLEKNTITVGSREAMESKTASTSVSLTSVNWIRGTPQEGEQLLVRTRYRQTLVPCTVHGNTIVFAQPQPMIGLGQSAVVYRSSGECVGGGIIDSLK